VKFLSYKAVALWALNIFNQAQFAFKNEVIRHFPFLVLKFKQNYSLITDQSAIISKVDGK
jgi:hypothetical protein